MYNDYALIKKSTLTDIGDAIRAQKGTSGLINPADFGSEIESIVASGNLDYLVRQMDDTTAVVQYKDGYTTSSFLSESKQYNFYDKNKNKICIGYASNYGLAYFTTPVDLTDVKSIWFGGWVGTNSDGKLTISVTAGILSVVPSSADVTYDKHQSIDISAVAYAGKSDDVRKEGSYYGLCLDVSDIEGEKYIAWSMKHGSEKAEFSTYLWLDCVTLEHKELLTAVAPDIFNHGDIVGLNPIYSMYNEVYHPSGTHWNISDEKIYSTKSSKNSNIVFGTPIYFHGYKYLCFDVEVTEGVAGNWNSSLIGIRKAADGWQSTNYENPFILTSKCAWLTSCFDTVNYDKTEPWYTLTRQTIKIPVYGLTEPYLIAMHNCECTVNIYSIWLE